MEQLALEPTPMPLEASCAAKPMTPRAEESEIAALRALIADRHSIGKIAAAYFYAFLALILFAVGVKLYWDTYTFPQLGGLAHIAALASSYRAYQQIVRGKELAAREDQALERLRALGLVEG